MILEKVVFRGSLVFRAPSLLFLALSVQGITLMPLQKPVCKGNIVELLCMYPDIQEVNDNGEPKYALTRPIWTQNDKSFTPDGIVYGTKTVNLTAEMLSINTSMTTELEDDMELGCCLVLTKNLNINHSNKESLSQIISEPPVPNGTFSVHPETKVLTLKVDLNFIHDPSNCFENGYIEVTLFIDADGSIQQYRISTSSFSFEDLNHDQSFRYEFVTVVGKLRSRPVNGSFVPPTTSVDDSSTLYYIIGSVASILMFAIIMIIVAIIVGTSCYIGHRLRKPRVKDAPMSPDLGDTSKESC